MRRLLPPNSSEEIPPDDYFQWYTETIDVWLMIPSIGQKDCALKDEDVWTIVFANKCKTFTRAYEMFRIWQKEMGKEGEGLRHRPYVLEQYDTFGEDPGCKTIFIFKCENNGDTYRIIDD